MTETVVAQPTQQTDLPHYRAFISYRHADVDSAVAEAVQHGLERFWVPKSARGEAGSVHIAPVFRDKEELPVSSRLGDDIEGALRVADALVVICSPRTQESSWVAREIETFLTWHSQDRVFVVLAEGEPYDVIPERLLYETRVTELPDGTTQEEGAGIEPLACDFRNPSRSWRRTELTRLAAAILGVSFDSLVRRAHRRRMRLMAAALALVTCVAAYALWSAARIRESYRQTQINESEALAVEAQELLAGGDRMEAIQVALAALPKSSTSGDRPYVPAAQIALQDALQAYPPESFWRSCYAVPEATDTCAIGDNGQQAILKADGTVQIADLKTGRALSTIDPASALSDSVDPTTNLTPTNLLFCDGGLICFFSFGRFVALFDTQTGGLLWSLPVPYPCVDGLALSHDHKTLAVGSSFGEYSSDPKEGVQVILVKIAEGTVQDTISLPFDHQHDVDRLDYKMRLCFSPDDRSIALGCSGVLWLAGLTNNEVNTTTLQGVSVFEVTWIDDTITCVTTSEKQSTVLLGAANFEAYTSQLKPLWVRTEDPPLYYDTASIYHSNQEHVVGTYDDKGGNTFVVYVSGSTIKFVNMKTGEEAFSIQEHSPLTACILKGGLLYTVDFEGSATVRYTGGLDSNATFGLANINVGSSEFATMDFVDDVPYLFAFDPNAKRMHVYRSLRRFTDIAGFESDERFNDMEADTIVQGTSDEGNGPAPNYLILKSDEGLTVLRDDSLDPLWSASFEELGVSAMEHSYSGDSVFYYTKASDDKTDLYTIKRVLLDTGEVVSTYEFARDAHHWISIESVGMAHVGNREALVIRGSREISYFSLDTSENLLNIDLEELNAQYAVQTGNTTLVFYVEGDEGRAAVFSLNDGQRIVGTDADSLSIANGYSPEKNVFVSESGLVAVSCADGYLRCLDSSNWEMLWEQRLAGLRTACFSVDGSRLFVQVSSGSCLLLDATTGEMLRSSSVQLPLISGFLYGQDPSTLYGYCLKTGLSRPETSMAIISLIEDTFGPTAVVYAGIFCLPKLSKVIVRDALFEDWGVQQLYSLDVLIALANEAIEGHELSEAERQLYRIAR